MVKEIVQAYTSNNRERFSKLLPRLGYDGIEEDLTSDGEWHNDVRDLGTVAFWKDKGKQGVAIKHVKFVGPDGSTAHGNGVYIIGKSTLNYIKQVMKQAKIKFPEYGIRKTEIDVNGRKIKAFDTIDCMPFFELLEKTA